MIYTILQKVPGGHGVRVFTGVCLVLGIGCAPVLYKKTRAGHDYFSSEKPEAVERGLEAIEVRRRVHAEQLLARYVGPV